MEEHLSADLAFEGVSHSFGQVQALADINLVLNRGIVGLLGPNGAGKSTLMNVASTALPPQCGAVQVAGHRTHDARGREAARRAIGYLPQRFSLMNWATCLRNVTYAAWAQGVAADACEEKAHAAMRVVGLDELSDRKVRTLSGGQRQRLGIACAIVHEPRVLLLDEPTVGLDPVQRTEIREHLRALGAVRTALVSTHIVEDLDRIADRILVLNQGTIIFDGERDQLVTEHGQTGAANLEDAYVRLMGIADRKLLQR